jgi:hypothetical protein
VGHFTAEEAQNAMVAANEYLTRTVDSSEVNLQEIEIPQQFADLGEWNEWVVGHFTRNEQ